jgi:hypothetical protein
MAVLLKLQWCSHQDLPAVLRHTHPWFKAQAIAEIHQCLSGGALVGDGSTGIEMKARADHPQHGDRHTGCLARRLHNLGAQRQGAHGLTAQPIAEAQQRPEHARKQ